MEPKKVAQALDDESWVEAMQEELLQFILQKVKQSEEGIFISQDKYVVEILKKFDFYFVKIASTLIETRKPLVKDGEATDVDIYLYRSMIGSLMYLTASRPDIMSAVCACSRFQVTPKLSHLHAVKQIFRYLKGIDNDIYSTVDACLNACEMWKAIASRANQDNSPRINRSTGYENQRNCNVAGARETVAYHREKMLLCKQEEAEIQLNAEQADWRDDTDDESKDQEMEAHYMYMEQIQEVSPDVADSGPIFDSELVQKVSTDDHYNVFAIESEHPEQSESVHDTYHIEQDEHNRKKNNVKARTTLLLSLPDEHQLRFSKYKTAKEHWAKRKKNLLKQQYGNFKAEGSETLKQTFNRLQVIKSQLQFMDVEVENDDLNKKFLTSLAPEWLIHTIVWRNRNDLDTMSLDDLYNHLKHSSRDEDGNTACVSTSSTTFPTASASVATISQDTASAYIASQSNGSQIKFEDINQIDEDDMEEIDIK
nr:hypothetical protein [Tanacetum cinerariifolium]